MRRIDKQIIINKTQTTLTMIPTSDGEKLTFSDRKEKFVVWKGVDSLESKLVVNSCVDIKLVSSCVVDTDVVLSPVVCWKTVVVSYSSRIKKEEEDWDDLKTLLK